MAHIACGFGSVYDGLNPKPSFGSLENFEVKPPHA
jgi:hypothetical protein